MSPNFNMCMRGLLLLCEQNRIYFNSGDRILIFQRLKLCDIFFGQQILSQFEKLAIEFVCLHYNWICGLCCQVRDVVSRKKCVANADWQLFRLHATLSTVLTEHVYSVGFPCISTKKMTIATWTYEIGLSANSFTFEFGNKKVGQCNFIFSFISKSNCWDEHIGIAYECATRYQHMLASEYKAHCFFFGLRWHDLFTSIAYIFFDVASVWISL